jgi:hypothetical protein
LLWVIAAGLAAGLVLLLAGCSVRHEDVWSIGIYAGDTPFQLHPHPAIGDRPVLTASDIGDLKARFVADPFMVRAAARWYMFFEALEEKSRRGVIGLATSKDGVAWRYQRIVLTEPFHLSYPYVFDWNGVFHMIPETGDAAAVRLYRAEEFPERWVFVGELLAGRYWDASIVHWEGLWWLFALDEQASLTLHYATEPIGPWVRHPRSPVVRNSLDMSRPGGRLIDHEGKLVRYAQDGEPTYGSRLRAFQIDRLTKTDFAEHEVPGSPVLAASGRAWHATGMHHADVHLLGDGRWIACVDGNRAHRILNWRAGVRRILKALM